MDKTQTQLLESIKINAEEVCVTIDRAVKKAVAAVNSAHEKDLEEMNEALANFVEAAKQLELGSDRLTQRGKLA